MDFTKLPVGFSMALAQNQAALTAYASMDADAKQAVLQKARRARSEQDMTQIVDTLASSPM